MVSLLSSSAKTQTWTKLLLPLTSVSSSTWASAAALEHATFKEPVRFFSPAHVRHWDAVMLDATEQKKVRRENFSDEEK